MRAPSAQRGLTSLDGDPGVVHVTTDMREDLGPLEAELADSLAVGSRLGRSGGRGELNVLDTECVEPVDNRQRGVRLDHRDRERRTHALAILILVSKVKKALANCSPSRFTSQLLVHVLARPSYVVQQGTDLEE